MNATQADGASRFDPVSSRLVQRTATSNVYENFDGSRTARIYSSVANVKGKDGRWTPADATVDAVPGAGFRVRNDVLGTTFAARADARRLVTVHAGDGTLSFGMEGAASTAGVASGVTVRYPRVRPGVDLLYAAAPAGFQKMLVLDAPPARGVNTWRFTLDTDGLTPRLRGDGAIAVLDATGAEALTIPAPRMWDSKVDGSGEGATGPVSMALSGGAGAWTVTLTADAEWLADGARKYPVYVDPSAWSSVNVQTSDDSYVRSAYPSTNYNSTYDTTTGKYVDVFGCYSDSQLTLLHYSLSSITGKDVVAATWHGNLVWSYYTNTPQSFYIHPAGGSWSASTVTWSNKPGYVNLTNSSGTKYTFAGSGYRGQHVTVGITPIVTSWLDSLANHGLYLDGGLLQNGADNCPAQYFKIASDQNTDGSSPYIDVDYNNAPNAPTLQAPSNGGNVHDLTPTLDVTATDTNGDSLKYYFEVCLDSTMTSCVASSGTSWLTSSAWTVPTGVLQWNRTYYWRARSYDGRLSSANSSVWSFTTANTPPAAPAASTARPIDDAVITSLTPTLTTGSVTDPDGDPVRYWFKVVAGSDGVGGSVVNSGWITTPSWTIPSGVVQDGVAYTWQVSTTDVDAGGNPMISIASAFTGRFRVDSRVGAQAPSPFDSVGSVGVNLFNGNAHVTLASPSVAALGGGIGLSYAYNSQLPGVAGLRGSYYNSPAPAFPLPSTAQLQLSRTDSQLAFTWPAKGPFPPALHGTYFQARWDGVITAPVTGTYHFGGIHDDGLKITVNNQTAYTHTGYAPTVDYTGATSISLTASVPVSLSVDYFNKAGPAQLHVYVKTTDNTTVKSQPLPASWLSTQVSSLPAGWTLGAGGSHGIAVASAKVTDSSVVVTDGTGSTQTYTWTGSGYLPPANGDAILSRNDDGTLRLLSGNGLTYTFSTTGILQSVHSGVDDRHPAAVQFSWSQSGGLPRLQSLTDPVGGRTLTLRYAGDAACPTAPAGFDSAPPVGMLCAADYGWNGTRTTYLYLAKQLARIVEPGGSVTDFGYTSGLLTSIRDVLATDWVAADPTVRDTVTIRPLTTTSIEYNAAVNGVSTVKKVSLPAPAPLDPLAVQQRTVHTYTYSGTPPAAGQTGYTTVTVTGLTMAQGFARKATVNANGQLLADADAIGRTTSYVWDARDNLLATTDPAGRMSTSAYDASNRRTDTYGPAPAACFDTNTASATYLRPLAAGCPAPNASFKVAHIATSYDEGLTGLAATWWDSPVMAGAPARHSTVDLPTTVDASVLPDGLGEGGFSGVLSGEIDLPSTGVYGFGMTPGLDTGVRLSVDDQVVIDRLASYDEAVRADSPDGYWRLGEASGTNALDASGNGKTGTYSGGVTFGVPGAPVQESDTAITLDGVNGHVKLPMSMVVGDGKSPLAVSAWFKIAAGKSGPIIGYQDAAVGATPTSYVPLVYVGTDGKVYGDAWPGPRLISPAVVTDGAWHHVVVMANPTGSTTTSPWAMQQIMCVDNSCQALAGTTDFKTMTFSQIGAAYTASGWPASKTTAGWWYFPGSIDDVAIYHSELPIERAAAQYAAARPTWAGTSQGRVSYAQAVMSDNPSTYWRLDEPAGSTTVADSSGYGNTGTVLTGTTLGGTGATGATEKSVDFDGALTSAITSTKPRAANNFTFESWIEFTSGTASIVIDNENNASVNGTTGEHYAFSPDNMSADAGAGLSVGSNGISVYEHGGSYMPPTLVWQPPPSQRPILGWHHVAVVYANRKPTLYVDGVAVRTGLTSSKPNVYSPSRIGSQGSYGAAKVGMDEVALYPTSLSSDRILAHYLAAKAVSAVGNGVLSAGKHRVRIDVRQGAEGSAPLQLTWTPPGSSTAVAIPSSAFTPRYSLATRTVVSDDDRTGVAGRTVSASYSDPANGIDPALGIAVYRTSDPGGLDLTSRNGYEAPSTGYLRRTTRTLPAGNGWTYTYYGDTEVRTNPCPGGTAANQSGLLKLVTGPDPDGAGPQQPRTVETVYDGDGRSIAIRTGSQGWACTTFDARGRIASVDVPARDAEPARTVTYDYAVGGNPLVRSTTDPAGTTTTTLDLRGRRVSYSDVWGNVTNYQYDLAGRVIGTTGPGGARSSVLDDADRVVSMKMDGAVIAVPSYDTTTGEMTSVTYPHGLGEVGNGTSLSALTRDPAGRVTGMTWSLANGVTVSDAVVRSQSGRIIDEIVDGVDADPSAPNFGYDGAGRLVRAAVPGHVLEYGFGSGGGCGPLASAGQNSHRGEVLDTVGTITTSTTYCWDNADRLVSSTSGGRTITPAYDSAGNVIALDDASGPDQTLTFDGGSRHVASSDGAGASVRYTRDEGGRIVARTATENGNTTTVRYGYAGPDDTPMLTMSTTGTVLARMVGLPGGVLVTLPAGVQPAGAPSGPVWSYPNVRGDVIATADVLGVKQGATRHYDPNGNPLSTLPTNHLGSADYGWEGSKQRLHEHLGSLDTIEMGARPYQPDLGIFLGVDPVEAGSANDYDYGNADPINRSDPSGLMVADATGGPDLYCIPDPPPPTPPQVYGPFPPEPKLGGAVTGSVGKIANKLGRTPEQIKDAIHKVKKNLPSGSSISNPDVVIDTDTGEVYPKLPDGSAGVDSIGNILDHLPEIDEGTQNAMVEGAKTGAAVGGALTIIWWLGKLASPACGPAAPACAVVL